MLRTLDEKRSYTGLGGYACEPGEYDARLGAETEKFNTPFGDRIEPRDARKWRAEKKRKKQ